MAWRPAAHLTRRGSGRGLLQCTSYLIDRHDTAQASLGIHRHQSADPPQWLATEQCLEGLVEPDVPGLLVRAHDLPDRENRLPLFRYPLCALSVDEPDEVATVVDDRKPRPSIA